MICPPCKTAGAALRLGKQSGEPIKHLLVEQAERRHGGCTDPNCTCQHEVTLDAVNEKGLK